MNKIVILAFFTLLIQPLVYAQDKKDLHGTWYAKIRGYEFKQDGTAQWYTKKEIAGYQQKLVIDKDLNYSYTEYYSGDTIKAKGRVFLNGDTLKFVITRQGMQDDQGQSFFLYTLNRLELIYSNFPVRRIIKEENAGEKIFQKVEMEAAYSLGNNEFLKSLYRSLATTIAGTRDSTTINSYEIKVDMAGNMDPATLRVVNADPGYFETVRQGLLNLRSNFKPAMQNGKPVSAYMPFRLTY